MEFFCNEMCSSGCDVHASTADATKSHRQHESPDRHHAPRTDRSRLANTAYLSASTGGNGYRAPDVHRHRKGCRVVKGFDDIPALNTPADLPVCRHIALELKDRAHRKRHHAGLGRRDAAVYDELVALAMEHDGRVMPSYAHLMAVTGYTRGTISRALRSLTRLGVIEVQRNALASEVRATPETWHIEIAQTVNSYRLVPAPLLLSHCRPRRRRRRVIADEIRLQRQGSAWEAPHDALSLFAGLEVDPDEIMRRARKFDRRTRAKGCRDGLVGRAGLAALEILLTAGRGKPVQLLMEELARRTTYNAATLRRAINGLINSGFLARMATRQRRWIWRAGQRYMGAVQGANIFVALEGRRASQAIPRQDRPRAQPVPWRRKLKAEAKNNRIGWLTALGGTLDQVIAKPSLPGLQQPRTYRQETTLTQGQRIHKPP